MKTKKFDQKLSLNKKTIAHLQDGAMQQAKGGDTGACYTSGVILCMYYCPTNRVECPSAPWTNCTAC